MRALAPYVLTGGVDPERIRGAAREDLPTLERLYRDAASWTARKRSKVLSAGLLGSFKRAEYFDGRVNVRGVCKYWIRVARPNIAGYGFQVGEGFIVVDEVDLATYAVDPCNDRYTRREIFHSSVDRVRAEGDGSLSVSLSISGNHFHANVRPGGEIVLSEGKSGAGSLKERERRCGSDKEEQGGLGSGRGGGKGIFRVSIERIFWIRGLPIIFVRRRGKLERFTPPVGSEDLFLSILNKIYLLASREGSTSGVIYVPEDIFSHEELLFINSDLRGVLD